MPTEVRDQAFLAQNVIRTDPKKVSKIVAREYHSFLKDGVTLQRKSNLQTTHYGKESWKEAYNSLYN